MLGSLLFTNISYYETLSTLCSKFFLCFFLSFFFVLLITKILKKKKLEKRSKQKVFFFCLNPVLFSLQLFVLKAAFGCFFSPKKKEWAKIYANKIVEQEYLLLSKSFMKLRSSTLQLQHWNCSFIIVVCKIT